MIINDFYVNATGMLCDDCGTFIKDCYVITDGTVTMTVGSECAKRLSESDPKIKREVSWVARIKKEWKVTPASETEMMFISRRLHELRNAYAAYGALIKEFGTDIEGSAHRQLFFQKRVSNNTDSVTRKHIVNEYINERLSAIECKYGANRYDLIYPIDHGVRGYKNIPKHQ